MANAVASVMRKALGKGVEALAAYNRARLPAPDVPHPFLSGIHAPMREELTLTDLAVTGTIPAALNGRYLRIGPNPVAANPASYHWFVGDGMVHAIALKDGRAAWYRNRWVRSHAVAKATGLPAAPGPRHVFDTVNTSVLAIGGQVYAAVEAGSYPVILDETLDGQRFDNFAGTLAGSFTAHPRFDAHTREYHAICYEGPDPDTIRHVVLDEGGRVTRELAIPVRHGPMVHDCGVTPRFVVILDLPITLSLRTLIAGSAFPYRWNPRHPARVGLLPREGGADDVIWCDLPAPAAAFHVANAYEDGRGRVVLDLCVYQTMFAGDDLDGVPRGLERWTVNPVTRAVEIATLDAAAQDLPGIDARMTGQRHRFVWTLALPDPDGEGAGGRLYSHDLAFGTRQARGFGPGRHAGEFVFVPEHAGAGEGEGWLMGLVIDEPADATDLVILDARRFEAPPVASVRIPHRVPPGFHGAWIADEGSG